MHTVFEDIYPEELWKLFSEICRIPHGSGNEKQLADYISRIADHHGFSRKTDSTGNLILLVPASRGCEHAPAAILQAHLDMVCEKASGSTFDFAHDPIEAVREGAWMTAGETTLGADNGIGVAAALSQNIVHGPLELLFTVDEESGMTGASRLSADCLAGRFLINLDSEETGAVYIGCSGGSGVDIALPLHRKPADPERCYAVAAIDGLQGGHSGLDIDKNRANAIALLAFFLRNLRGCDVRIADMQGGDKHNAIPRYAAATFSIEKKHCDRLQHTISTCTDIFKKRFAEETGISIRCEPAQSSSTSIPHKASADLINMLLALPNGILAMSRNIPGLVETSNNLASIRAKDSTAVIHCSPRSSVPESLDAAVKQVCAVADLAGAAVSLKGSYPGWQPDRESQLLHLAEKVHSDRFGKKPAVKAVHAGLECGIIKNRYPDMDMISIGPDIRHAHSPREAVNIESVGRFWNFVTSLLKAIADTRP